ncbi:hypothetical protein COO72_10490 [Bifidobacterium callitrichos]|nr:hypothetical protein COO72_10490 [Bifidobacterium callitrichos]
MMRLLAAGLAFPLVFLVFNGSPWVLVWMQGDPSGRAADYASSLAFTCLLSPAVVSLASKGLLG